MASIRTLLLAGATIAVMGVNSSAYAISMSQTATVDEVAGVPIGLTDLNRVAFAPTINQFDAAGIAAANPGSTVTLNDVMLSYNPTAMTLGTLTNTSSSEQFFQFGLALTTFINTPGALTAAQQIIKNNFGLGTAGQLVLNFGTQTYDLVPTQSASYPQGSVAPYQLSGTTSKTLADSSSLAAFTGNGSFGLNLSTLSTQSVTGGGGNIVSVLNTEAGANFTVVYDYTLTSNPSSVPEPASMALIGAGLVGAGLLRRRAEN